MNEKTKESKFLDAINRYAESQKAQITKEIEDYKNTKIEQATEQGLQDAYELIQGDIAKRKAAIVNDTAKQELDMRKSLFAERSKIAEEVFSEAESKLKGFVLTEDYISFLKRSLTAAAGTFGGQPCIAYVRPDDCDKSAMITEYLSGAQIKTDVHIHIGGIKVYCPSMGITADDTLDTRLADQKDWFISHAGLKVV